MQALALAILVAGCSRAALPASAPTAVRPPTATAPPTVAIPSPTATPRPVLTSVDVTLPGVLDTLDPLLSASASARAVASLVFSGLVAPGVDGQFRPDLAASWGSTDGLTWAFHLDPHRRWQDGAAVTSADVAYTLGLIDAAGSPVDPALRSAWQGIRFAAPDAETVVLTVPATLGADILDLATLPILPAHLLAATPADALALLPFSSRPVGSGAYRVVAANSLAATLQLADADDLAPRQLRITMISGGAGSAPAPPPVASPGRGAVTALGIGAATAPTVRAALARPVFVFLNMHDSTLADLAVRQALNLAINRQLLISGPLHGAAAPLRSPLTGGLTEVDSTGVPGPDAAAASAALQTAGWLSASGGGRERQGVPLAITLLVDDDPTRLAVAQAVAADWQAIGVKTTVEKVGLDGLLRDFAVPGHYQAALLGMQQQGILPDLADLWHTGGALNISGWSDPLADAALDATHAPSRDTRQTGYLRFAQRFADEVPAIPLYLPTVGYAVTGVRLTVGTLNDPSDILRDAVAWRAS
jgi:peptide/nickel transport system substrate-binding protein